MSQILENHQQWKAQRHLQECLEEQRYLLKILQRAWGKKRGSRSGGQKPEQNSLTLVSGGDTLREIAPIGMGERSLMQRVGKRQQLRRVPPLK